MHEENNSRISLFFQLSDLAGAHPFEHALTQHRLQGAEHEEEPNDVSDGHFILLYLQGSRSSRRIEAKEALIGVVGPALALGQEQQASQNCACNEASNMRPPGDARSRRGRQQFCRTLQQLQQDPNPNEDDRRHYEEEREKQYWNHNDETRQRK